MSAALDPPLAGLRGDERLSAAIDELSNQLCLAVDGDFDFAVHSSLADETIEKLSMLINFVLDTARRGMAALREHNEALGQLDQAKTVFFSNASHELRTPLTLILGPLEDALAHSPPSLSAEALASAHRNALRLLKLVNALLDFSRIEAGRLQAQFEPTDLGTFTQELASVFRAAVERAGLELSVDCPPLARPVPVDRQMWEKIVLNLLSNAFKFTFEGGIGVTLREFDDRIEMAVRDSGVGIDAAELPRIFERFHRVPGVRSRTHEGFGIGLAMIQELVELHGGTIGAQSEPGRGSTFTVRVPRRGLQARAGSILRESKPAPLTGANPYVIEAESWLSAPRTEPTQRPVAAPDQAAHILVVDDNADMRAYTTRLLAAHWTVSEAADGAEALARLVEQRPDLVLSDVMMPNVDGHELLRRLRANPATVGIPVVLLTARAGEEAVVEGMEAGADDYLVKPFSGRELVARVRTLLRLSRARSDAMTIERIGALLNSKRELREVVQLLTDEAARLCGAQFGAFFHNELDASGERSMLYTLAGAPQQAFPMSRNAELLAPTFRGKAIVRLADVTQDPRYARNAPQHGAPPGHLPMRSYLAVPVVSRTGNVLGGLFFGHREPGVFTERAERVLAAVANHAAIALENAQLYRNEQKARAEAEAAIRAKDEFLAMLGHELRNPLAPIVTALEVMRLRNDRASEPERGIIGRQVKHMVRLVDDLLDISRIARGKIDLRKAPVTVAGVIEKALEMASPLFEAKRHELRVEVPDSLWVLADRVRLEQVFVNLLTNAAKFTDAGGRISVTAAKAGGEVIVRIRDCGIGIAAEQMPKIFDMFSQGEQSLDRSRGGLGLGLAIARNLVELHGGRIEAASEGPGTGSEFLVRIASIPGPAAADRPDADSRPAASARKRRVLVVDDNPDAALMLASMLELTGHTVAVRPDGPSALRAAAEFRPDVVLLDIGLPVMDGYQVARELRRRPETRGVRLIALSGYGQENDRARTAAAGFDEHLIKPVELAALQAAMLAELH